MKKIYFTQLLAAILLLCGTLTANAEKVTGYAGLGVEWELDTESGELVFSGFGDMYMTNKVYSTIHFNEYKEQIKSVKIGRNIKSISPYLFDGLTNLESIDIPSSIEQIAEYIIEDARSTFIGTAWWNSQPDGLVYLEDWLIGYKGEKPAGEITIKNGTKGICQRAFSRCEEITKVILPSSVQYIRYSAFEGCTSLTDINLPEGLLYINDRAFGNCSSLANISIPSSVIHISIDVFDGTAWHNSRPDGLIYIDNWFYGFKGEAPAGELVIADETKGIAGGALRGCKELTTVSLPAGLKSIGSYAFEECGFETITVPNGVLHIGRFAFQSCVNLKEFAFSHWIIAIETIEQNILSGCNNLESIGETAGAYIFEDNCIYTSEYHHEHSENILLTACGTQIPQTVDYIDSYAFYGNEKVTEIVVPEGVKSIGEMAFGYCPNLTSITLPASITHTGAYITNGNKADVHISDLQAWCNIEFVTPESNPLYDASLYLNGELVTDLVIPAGITEIKKSTFTGCNSITSVTIPQGVTSIGSYAFYNCKGLKSITSLIPAENLFAIDSNTFQYVDKNACTLYVPAGAKETYAATEGWSEFTNIVEIPYGKCGDNATWAFADGVLTISGTGDMYDFSNAENIPWYDNKDEITSVITEDGITSIGDNAFYNCSNIQSLRIGVGVTRIGQYVLRNCNAITNIVIPASVVRINKWAFAYNGNISSIIIHSNNPVYDSRENCNAIIETATNTIQTGCTNTIIPSSVTTIGNGSFAGCTGLTSINIPEGVETIEANAFRDCSNLEEISIPSTVTNIKDWAFENCANLTTAHISSISDWCKINFKEINYFRPNIYVNDTLVTSIEIPEDITEIKQSTFSYLAGISSVTIHSNVTSISHLAFNNYNNLTSLISLIPAENLYEVYSSTFDYLNNSGCTLYVPAGAKETYAATEGWNRFTNIVEMIEEPFALTVSAARYATLYLDYNAVIPAGLRVYYAEKIEGETLLMERINDVIPANTGVIVTGAAGTYKFDKAFEEVAAIENNLFQGSVEDTYITPEKGTKYYVLSMVDGVVGMYLDELAGGTFKNNAHKAYLPLSGESLGIFDTTVNAPDVQLSNRYTFNFGGVTAVESITTTASDEAIYNLNGQRVENPTKGIYIRGGKKVVY